MCTTVILRRPDHDWPIILAANRDEMMDRPWRGPDRHWEDRPEVRAGLDLTGGGSWLGVNDHGVVAAILNRVGSLGPMAGKRSRGELVLEALDHADAAAAATALTHLDPAAYRSFNLLIADCRDAFWLRNQGGRADRIEPFEVPEGLSMLTARDLNDQDSPRIRRHLPRFRAAPEPEPETEDWQAWQEILATGPEPGGDDPFAAMTIATAEGFGTVSASLIALPAPALGEAREPIWLFAPGPPDRTGFEPLDGAEGTLR